MKSYVLDRPGADGLSMAEKEIVRPGAGRILVRMQSASLNHRDLSILEGHYPNGYPLVPLSDGAGFVEEVGEGVTDLKPGDPVVSCFYPLWHDGEASAENHRLSLGCETDGVLAEYVTADASAFLPAPRGISPAEAACLPCAGLTAWTALFTEGRLEAGQHVLLQGTGGVSIFALQMAKAAGATVTLLSASAEKAEKAKAFGADHIIDYRAVPQWAGAVTELTDGRGVDLVLDVGGAETLSQSLTTLRVGGRISVIGVLSGLEAGIFVPELLFRHIYLTGITVGHHADFRKMCRFIETHNIRPVVHRHFAFAEAGRAYDLMRRAGHFGKIVIDIEG